MAVVFMCIVGAIYKKKRVEGQLLQRALESAQRKLIDKEALTPSEQHSLGQSTSLSPRQMRDQRSQGTAPRAYDRPVIPTGKEIVRTVSQESITSFAKEAQIELQMPGSFEYTTLNTDEGFAGIYGEDSQQNAKLTGLAYNKVATPQQVTAFLKEDADSIPNIAQNPISQMGGPQTLPPPPPESGFSGGTLWNGKLANGESVAAVYIERADKQGSYLFVLSGPDAYFNNNDGAFDSVYEKAKALGSKPQQPQQGK